VFALSFALGVWLLTQYIGGALNYVIALLLPPILEVFRHPVTQSIDLTVVKNSGPGQTITSISLSSCVDQISEARACFL
jgi:hypothetical protein